jgi:hypothetical protein
MRVCIVHTAVLFQSSVTVCRLTQHVILLSKTHCTGDMFRLPSGHNQVSMYGIYLTGKYLYICALNLMTASILTTFYNQRFDNKQSVSPTNKRADQ